MKSLIALLVLAASMSVANAQRHPVIFEQWYSSNPTYRVIPVRPGQKVLLYLDCFPVYPEICAGGASYAGHASFSYYDGVPVEFTYRLYRFQDAVGNTHEFLATKAPWEGLMTVYANITFKGNLYRWTLLTVDK
jgi:hypothetical protein